MIGTGFFQSVVARIATEVAARTAAISLVVSNLANNANPSQGDKLIGVKRSPASSIATNQHARNEVLRWDVAGDSGAPTDGVTSAVAAITNAMGAASHIRFSAGQYYIDSNLTITAYCEVDKGASFVIAAGKVLTFGAGVGAGLWKIFSGTGTVAFAQSSQLLTVPHWWGASTSASAAVNSAAMQAWVNASYGCVNWLPQGGYQFNGFAIPPIAQAGVSQTPFILMGQGFDGNGGTNGTTLYLAASAGAAHGIDLTNAYTNSNADIRLEGFQIVGPNDTVAGGDGIHATLCSGLKIKRVQVTACRGNGIFLQSCYGASIEDVGTIYNALNGIQCYKQTNAVKLTNVKSFSNGKRFDQQTANISFGGGAGFENLGPTLDNCDASYAGQVGTQWKRSNASLTSITVAGGVATATTAAAHGLTTGNFVGVYGATVAPLLNSRFIPTITVTSATAFTFPTTAANGTYTESTLVIGPPSVGLSMQNTWGARVNLYCEDCIGPAAYIGPTVVGVVFEGGYIQGVGGSGVMTLDDPSNCEISGITFWGQFASLYQGLSVRQHGVNVHSSCVFSNSATNVEPAFPMRDGQYYGDAVPTVGAWPGPFVSMRKKTPVVGLPTGYYQTVVGSPGTWVAGANL